MELHSMPKAKPSGSFRQPDDEKASRIAPMPWYNLPLTVQLQILRELSNDYNRDLAEDKKHRAAYAAVSLEWQGFFEASHANFGKLVLHQTALDAFQKITQRRQKNRPGNAAGDCDRPRKRRKTAAEGTPPAKGHTLHIRHIWLRVELQEYGCKNCKTPETGKEKVRNNVRFTAALWKLLDILSTWEKGNIDHHQGLTLEFSAYSPSDSRHMFQNDELLQDTYPYLAEIDSQRQYLKQHVGRVVTDHFHGFNNGLPPMALYSWSWDRQRIAQRLIPEPLEFDFFGVRFRRGQSKAKLPEVKTVTSFLIRRQYYRDICPWALERLFDESLTNVRDVRHERWRKPDELDQSFHDWSYGPTQESPGRGILRSMLPASLESLHIFEDFKASIHGREASNKPRPSRIEFLKGLATSAPGIKHLSVSFVSDAMDCLTVPEHATFANIQSLALTSQAYLRPTRSFNELLHKAALAAMKMPKLQIMEIWSCRVGYAAVFRYEATGTTESSACRLTLRCSWHATPIRHSVVKAWENVASTIASRRLVLDTAPLPLASYYHYGSIFGQLKLRDSILHDISQMQVRVRVESKDEVDVPVWRPTTPYLPSSYGGDLHQPRPE